MFAENLPDMKHLYLLAVCACLFALPACEKLSEEPETTVDDTPSGSDDSQDNNGSDNGSGSGEGSGSSDDNGSGSGGTGDDGGDNNGNGNGIPDDAYSTNDSTYYSDSDDPYVETDIVDGDKKDNTDDDSGSTGTGSGSSGGSTGGNESGTTTGSSYNYYIEGEKGYSVSQFLSQTFDGMVWVVGYVVGDCTQSISNANFEPPFSQPQAVLLADDPQESNATNVIAIQLSGSSRRVSFSLESNPEYHRKRRLAVLGNKTYYLNVFGMKSGKGGGIGAMRWYD